jgi:hypothetical protein
MELMLKNVRIGFPHLFTADEYEGQKAFTGKFFIQPGSDNDIKIRDAILKEAKLMWPEKYEFFLEEFKMDKKAYCYIDGKRVEYAGAEGMWVLTSRRKESDGRPLVIDQRLNPLAESDGKPYAGCFVNVKLTIYAQDGKNKGIRCSLQTVQFSKDGDSFGGAKVGTVDGFDLA